MAQLIKNAILTALVIVLSACATVDDPPPSPYAASDLLRIAPSRPEFNNRLSWSISTRTRVEDSLTPAAAHGRLLAVIAYTEAHANTPCRNLALVSIVQLSSKPVTAAGASLRDAIRTYRPGKYFEQWQVDSCGRLVSWLLFDGSDNRTGELTMLRSVEAFVTR
jgi:hypothetical protein